MVLPRFIGAILFAVTNATTILGNRIKTRAEDAIHLIQEAEKRADTLVTELERLNARLGYPDPQTDEIIRTVRESQSGSASHIAEVGNELRNAAEHLIQMDPNAAKVVVPTASTVIGAPARPQLHETPIAEQDIPVSKTEQEAADRIDAEAGANFPQDAERAPDPDGENSGFGSAWWNSRPPVTGSGGASGEDDSQEAEAGDTGAQTDRTTPQEDAPATDTTPENASPAPEPAPVTGSPEKAKAKRGGKKNATTEDGEAEENSENDIQNVVTVTGGAQESATGEGVTDTAPDNVTTDPGANAEVRAENTGGIGFTDVTPPGEAADRQV